MRRRDIGSFKVSSDIVENPDLGRAFALLEFVPIRVEALYYSDVFDMLGYSPLFEEVPPHMIPPQYEITIGATSGRVTSVSVRRVAR